MRAFNGNIHSPLTWIFHHEGYESFEIQMLAMFPDELMK